MATRAAVDRCGPGHVAPPLSPAGTGEGQGPSIATAQFQRFFDCGRAVRCVLPLGGGRVMHLFVLDGYKEADRDPERLALTDQLLDAALGELGVVAREQPCLLVGDFNVEPTKIPCLAKGIMAGLWVDLEEAWVLAAGLRPAPTCKRGWTASGRNPGVTCKQDLGSSLGSRRDFMVGCPRVAAADSGCEVLADRWVVPHFAVRSSFDYSRWLARVSLPIQRSLLWLASWLPVQWVWDVYDDRLQFMSWNDGLNLDDSLARGDVSSAWLIWSSAVEAALADACRFAGGPVPDNGLVLGRGVFRSRSVRLGGPKVRRARRNFADPLCLISGVGLGWLRICCLL